MFFFSNKAVFCVCVCVYVSVKRGKSFLRQAELIITLGTAYGLLWGLGVASIASAALFNHIRVISCDS